MLPPKVAEAIRQDLLTGLKTLGLVPKVKRSSPGGRASWEKLEPEILRFVDDSRPLYRVGYFWLTRWQGEGVVNPALSLADARKVEEWLGQRLGVPVKLYSDVTGLKAIAVAYSGKVETLLPLRERAGYLPPVKITGYQTGGAGSPATARPDEPVVVPPKLVLPKLVDFYENISPLQTGNGELKLCLGVGDSGRLVASLQELNHILICGGTDAGKSTLLYTLCAQVLMGEFFFRGQAQVALIDPRVVTFNHPLFAGLPQLFGGYVAHKRGEITAMLAALSHERSRREALFNLAPGFPDKLAKYNAVAPAHLKLPLIVVFIEEISSLALALREELTTPLQDLTQTGRKYGIYVVMAGQNFRADNLPKIISDMCETKLAIGQLSDDSLRVLNFEPKSSRITEAVKGRGLVKLGSKVVEYQGLYLDKADFVRMVNRLREQEGLTQAGQGDWEEAMRLQSLENTEKFNTNLSTPIQPANSSSDSADRQTDRQTEGQNELKSTDLGLKNQTDRQTDTEIMSVARFWEAGAKSSRAMAAALNCGKDRALKLIEMARAEGLITD